MAVTEFEYKGCKYWRVYRAWDNKRIEIQRYIPMGNDPEKSRKEAEEEDESARQRQRAFYMRRALKPEYHIAQEADAIKGVQPGQIRGIRKELRTRKGRNPVLVFACRVNVPWEDEVCFTSISITKHGLEEAHRRAVKFYCDCYGFDERSEIRKKLLATLDAYRGEVTLKDVRETQKAPENSDLVDVERLKREIEEFNRQRKLKVIRGRQ